MSGPEDEEGRSTEEGDERERARSGRLTHLQGSWEEGPRHAVTLTRGFWMGTTLVTQAPSSTGG